MDLVLFRVVFILILAAIAFFLQPFAWNPYVSGAVGAILAASLVVVERRLRHTSLKRLLGATVGLICGATTAVLISLVIEHTGITSNTAPFLQLFTLAVALYLGFSVGASRGEMLNIAALSGVAEGGSVGGKGMLLLDTSVIIDGRIADVAETGILSGVVAIPQFVLRELQLVADSADSLKRNRGRRGLDILQRIQKLPHLDIKILEEDFPQIREVDLKLIELAKNLGARVVTNDFNLNKVAQLHRVAVLNLNELANALKPVVLPGEVMRVFILKEGKEYNQGVAYLDDGTMVVVDNARRQISKTIDIAVTSVLQTTAGKMIFGRFDERTHAVHDKVPASPDRLQRDASPAST